MVDNIALHLLSLSGAMLGMDIVLLVQRREATILLCVRVTGANSVSSSRGNVIILV